MEKEKSIDKYFDEAIRKINEGMNRIAAKTDELTRKGRIKFEIVGIKREIERYFNELGHAVFELSAEHAAEAIGGHEDVTSKIERIQELQRELEEKKAEYDRISAEDEAEPQEAVEEIEAGPKEQKKTNDEEVGFV